MKRTVIMKLRLAKALYFIINVVIPMAIGLVFYLTRRPGSIVTVNVSRFFPTIPFSDYGSSLYFPFENHLADVIWAYVLTIVLAYFLDYRKAVVIAIVFETGVEALQLLPFVNATFDILDILFEAMATVAALVMILIYWRIIKNEEKQNRKDDKPVSGFDNVCRNGDGK